MGVVVVRACRVGVGQAGEDALHRFDDGFGGRTDPESGRALHRVTGLGGELLVVHGLPYG